jgi:hypothetical protein
MGICRTVNAVANREGSAVLTVRANSFAWVARWVLGYGRDARILGPYKAVAVIAELAHIGE